MWDLAVEVNHNFSIAVGVSSVLVHSCPSMLGEGGTKTFSTTRYSGPQYSIDVENPNPGSRPGQLHLQTGGEEPL